MGRKTAFSRLIALVLTVCMVIGMAPAVSALNPAVQGWYTADPAPVVFSDDPDTLWVYTSHDEDQGHGQSIGGYNMKDYKCFSTEDMVNWTYHGTPVGHQTFSTWSEPDGSAWAQQVVERNGKYYCYAPIFHDTKAWCIGVAVSDSPTGPFVDAIDKPLYDAGWSGIDPTVFVDDDGQAYMYWGNPTLYCAKLNEDMVSLGRFTRDEVDPTWATVRSDGTLEMNMTVEAFGYGGNKDDDPDIDPAYQEGPWFFKRGETYYMVYPSIVDGSGESMSYSTSPGPIGPWTYGGVILDTTKQGEPRFNCYTIHGGTIDFKGHSYLFYHNGGLPDGGTYKRSIAVEEFTWGEDGSIPYIPRTNEGPDPVEALDPYALQEAETIAWSEGIRPIERSDGTVSVQQISNNDSIRVMNADFGSEGAVMFTAKTLASSTGGSIEVYLDSKNAADRIATVNVPDSGGYWAYTTVPLSKEVTGVHDIYYVFKTASANQFEFDNWSFTQAEEGMTPDSVVGLSVSADTYAIDTAEGRNEAVVSVTAIYADGRTEDVSGKAVLTGDEYASASGNIVTGKAFGTANVSVAYGGKEAQIRFTVKDLGAILTVTDLKADVNSLDLFVAGTRQLKLTASFADGHTEDVTAKATYATSNEAAVSCAAGLITAMGEGKATITASFEGKLGGKHSVEIAVTSCYRDPFGRLEAETYNEKIGRDGNCLVDTVTTDSADPNGHSLGYIQANDWLKLSGVKFDRAAVTLTARLASEYREFNIELRKNALDGELLGRITGATTGAWSNWKDIETAVDIKPGEAFDLYIVFVNGDCDINWIKFGDHIHEFENVVLAPTCTEEGYTASACKYCDVKTVASTTPSLGHSWDEGKVTLEPTTSSKGIKTFHCTREGCDGTKTRSIPPIGAKVIDVDFTDAASVSDFEILKQADAAIVDGKGLTLVTTMDSFEPCNGQIETFAPKDVVKVPVVGDWTATLEFDADLSGAGNGYYQFFGMYAAEGEDYQNLAGIRGGDGALQNFLRVDGAVTADSSELNSAPGLAENRSYWYRIAKEGESYTCYRSDDGESFNEMFSYADTGIDADSILIDAYTGMTEGYAFTLKSLVFEAKGDEVNCEHDYAATVTEPTCTEVGFSTYTCSKCNDSYTAQEVDALGHDYKEEVTESTCTDKGFSTFTCTRCDSSYKDKEVAALGHDYKEEVTEPTCTDGGYTTYTCARCDNSYKDKEVAALGHEFKEHACIRCDEEEDCPVKAFTDAPAVKDWAHAGIDYCVEEELMKGTSDTLFSPANSLTRAQIATILYRIAGEPEVEYKAVFSDVADGVWYTNAIIWAAEEEIVNGYPGGTFAPNKAISREQIATILYRYVGSPKAEEDLKDYPDAGAVSTWAKDGMAWAVEKGLINGIKSGEISKLAPQKNATRAQFATVIMRFQALDAQ